MDDEQKSWFRRKVEDGFHAAVVAALNSEKAAAKAAGVRQQFPGMSKDALAHVLTKRAARKTMIEGAASGAAVTAAEGTLASPEPASKPLVLSGIGALIVSDIAYATKVQMQLLLEIGEIYECPFNKDDEDDVWIILKAAFGLRGTERAGAYGRFIFTEGARKQFRAFLRRHGFRRAVQQAVAKVAGAEVAKRVSERALLALVPAANALFGALFNRWVTRRVGKWAKVKAKIRASALRAADELVAIDRHSALAALAVIHYVGTAGDQLVDNTLMLYAQTARRLALSEDEIGIIETMLDMEDVEAALWEYLEKVSDGTARKHLLDVAVTSAAATRLTVIPAQHDALERLSARIGASYSIRTLEQKIAFLAR
jgi:hypothetical protein